MVTSNNAINNTIGGSNSGQTNTFTILNSSNTASSQARMLISVGGTSAGDPFTTYTISGGTSWSEGADTSDSGKFKISLGTALGTTDKLTIDTSGNVTMAASLRTYTPIVTQSTSYTLALTDANTQQICTSSTAMTVTVPNPASVAYVVGTEIDIYQEGTGQVSIASAGIAIINSAFSNLKIAAQYTSVSLKMNSVGNWDLWGNLTA